MRNRISFVKGLLLVVLGIVLFTTMGSSLILASEEDKYDLSDGTSFKMNEQVLNQELDSGVVHNKYTAWASSPLSGFSSSGSDSTGGPNEPNKYYPQSVNTLEIPKNTDAKIVSWSLLTQSSWSLATVKQTAENFEKHNPGWQVIAAVNGDFFDISGTGAFPYTTSGVTIANGRVLKPVASGKTVGFANNGSNESLVVGKFETAPNHYLYVYDETGKVILEKEIKSINSLPEAGELSLYYTYKYMGENSIRVQVESEATAKSLLCTNSVQSLGQSSTVFYGEGNVAVSEFAHDLNPTQFAIYTTNQEVLTAVGSGAKVRVQKKPIGVFAGVENVTGAGVTLVENGNEVLYGNKERHPRTVVGRRADGTVVFITVDGRQAVRNMYGMTYDETTAMLLYYDCVEGYNLDGGGSTTIVVREDDKWVTHNSPSDGSERRDGNSLLIVVPKITPVFSKVTGTSATITVPVLPEFKNVKVSLGGKTYDINGTLVLTDLVKRTRYDVEVTYDYVSDFGTVKKTGAPTFFLTGMSDVQISNLKAVVNNGLTIITFNASDPDGAILSAYVNFNSSSERIEVQEGLNEYVIPLVDIQEVTLKVRADYQSTPREMIETIFNVTPVAEKEKPGGCKSGNVIIGNLLGFAAAGAILLIIKKK